MKESSARDLEATAFRTLNAVAEPLVRAGVGGPLLTPFGAISLEVTGRHSGKLYRVPLLATVIGEVTVVATFRGRRSEWVKNLAAAETAVWWANGVQKEGTAVVFAELAKMPLVPVSKFTLAPLAMLG